MDISLPDLSLSAGGSLWLPSWLSRLRAMHSAELSSSSDPAPASPTRKSSSPESSSWQHKILLILLVFRALCYLGVYTSCLHEIETDTCPQDVSTGKRLIVWARFRQFVDNCRLIKHQASKDPNRKGCSIVLYLVVCLGVVGVAAVARAGGLVGGAALGLAVTQPPPRRSCSP